jgi:hypothetical protein
MKKLILMLTLAAFACSPLLTSTAEAASASKSNVTAVKNAKKEKKKGKKGGKKGGKKHGKKNK